jgi:hypothetical protein
VSKTLPLPIRFELPGPEWQPVEPESVGVSNAAFLAARQPLGSSTYRPTITISGDWRNDDADLEQIADESVVKVQQEAGHARLADRRSVGTDDAPAVVQVISAAATIRGQLHDLRQLQTVAAYVDAEDHTRRIVVLYTLSCTADQLETAGHEYQQFMATVEVVPDDEATWQS